MKPDYFSMTGRRALITGAARGIGLAIAEAFAWHGAAVVIQDIDEALAQSEAARVSQLTGVPCAGLGGDLADLDAVAALPDAAGRAIGPIDVLVNNGAVQKQAPFEEATVADMRWQLEADVLAPTVLCQKVLPAMRAQHWGRILNIGSMQGVLGNPGMVAYAMSKGALVNLTSGLGRRLIRDGITVNLIAPGWFDTWRNRDHIDDAARERARQNLPAGRLGLPGDCAGAALLLCSDAGSYITGQSFLIDGGLTRH